MPILSEQSGLELRAPIFDIQRFSVHDGPGIRTLIFMKGCQLRCAWCANPESQHANAELLFAASRCNLCENCLAACEQGAISLMDGVIKTDRGQCIVCGECAASCYSGARRIAGREMTVEQVYREVEKDHVFYRTSGGGVTVSGGEPTMWPDFVGALLSRVRHHLGVTTAIETCGFTPWSHLEKIVPTLDSVFFDIKHMDCSVHKELTGVENSGILDNLNRLNALDGLRIVVRIPVIPTKNDQAQNMIDTGRFVAGLRSVQYIELLPYHRLGKTKYEGLDREYPLDGLPIPSREALEEAAELIRAQGVKVTIGG